MTLEQRLIAVLGKSRFSQADAEEARALLDRPFDAARAAVLARKNKVAPCVDANLRVVGTDQCRVRAERFREALPVEPSRDVERRHGACRRMLMQIASLLARERLTAVAVKGASLLFLLPCYANRVLGDVDLLFPDSLSVWLGARALLKAGYVIAEDENSWILSAHGEGADVHVHVTLHEPGAWINVDMRSCAMTLGLRGFLDCDVVSRAKPATGTSGGLMVPSVADALLVLIAQSYDRGFVTLKDLNDAYELSCALDWTSESAYIEDRIRVNGLQDVVAYMSSRLESHYGVRIPVRDGAGCSPPRWLLSRTDPLTGDPTDFRVALFHAASVLGGCADHGLLARVARAWSSFRWFAGRGYHEWSIVARWQELRARLRDRLPFVKQGWRATTPLLLCPVPDASAIVRRVPWDEVQLRATVAVKARRAAAGIFLLEGGGETLLLTPAGLYAPSRDLVFTEVQWSRLEAIASDVASVLAAGCSG